MNHSEYKRLTIQLETFTEYLEHVIDGINTGQQGPQFWSYRAYCLDCHDTIPELINELEDGIVEDCQTTRSQGLNKTPDQRRLYKALASTVRLVEDEKTTVFKCQYTYLAKCCWDVIKQFNYYFPKDEKPGPADRSAKVKEFAKTLVKTSEYKKAVEDGKITEPFTWNGTQKELADWLSNIVGTKMVAEKLQPQWSKADKLFSAMGVHGKMLTMTNKKLSEAYRDRDRY